MLKPLLKKSLITLALVATGSSYAATRWDMATPYPDATYHTQNIVQFANDVKSATDGELEIVVHSGSSLIKHPEIARAVRTQQVLSVKYLSVFWATATQFISWIIFRFWQQTSNKLKRCTLHQNRLSKRNWIKKA